MSLTKYINHCLTFIEICQYSCCPWYVRYVINHSFRSCFKTLYAAETAKFPSQMDSLRIFNHGHFKGFFCRPHTVIVLLWRLLESVRHQRQAGVLRPQPGGTVSDTQGRTRDGLPGGTALNTWRPPHWGEEGCPEFWWRSWQLHKAANPRPGWTGIH